MKTIIHYPTRIVFGQGVVKDLPEELLALGATKPLLVTDRGLAHTSIPENIMQLCKQKGIEMALFSEIEANPTEHQVESGTKAFEKEGADSIVALGGGSPMDAGKAIQIRIHHRLPLLEYDDLKGGDSKITQPLPSLIAIPTTAGTGSEVSRSAVITIPAVGRKVVLFSPRLMPSVAICDPELTYGLPSKTTAETGMDALSHCLEAFLAKGYHPMADAIALQGIRMIAHHLPTAVKDPTNVLARQEMMMASTMGAVAFQKGLGVIHSLAHPLSTISGLSHGLANAILMPHAIRFNAKAAKDRLTIVAAALNATDHTAEGAAHSLEHFLFEVGLPTTLNKAGVLDDQIPLLSEKAMEDGCHQSNPVLCTRNDMELILKSAL